MAGEVDPQRLLTALSTEHFTLQGARAQTVSESAARSTLYLGSVSGSLVALGLAQVSKSGDDFLLFALVILPTVYFLGLFTFVRLVDCACEDILYGLAINRIRRHYIELAGEEARYFMLVGYDDIRGVRANMALGSSSRWHHFFRASSAVAVVNAVIGGGAIAIVLGITLGLAHPIAAAGGGVVTATSLVLSLRYDRRRHEHLREGRDALFPSPEPAG